MLSIPAVRDNSLPVYTAVDRVVYPIAHNRIDIADPSSAGIRIRGYAALGSVIESATITDNDVTMSPPEGAVFGVGSAGIEIRGMARGNLVRGNTIRGRARVALSVESDKAGDPVGNTLDRNDRRQLISQFADGDTQK